MSQRQGYHIPNLFLEIGGRVQVSYLGQHVFFVQVLAHLQKKILLALKIFVYRPLTDPGLVRDILDLAVAKTRRREHLHRRLYDLFSLFLFVNNYRHGSSLSILTV